MNAVFLSCALCTTGIMDDGFALIYRRWGCRPYNRGTTRISDLGVVSYNHPHQLILIKDGDIVYTVVYSQSESSHSVTSPTLTGT